MAEITFTGLAQVQARLAQLAQQVPEIAGAALRAEAEIEMTEAKQRTPVLTGALRASGHVTGPDISGNTIEVHMNFGGPAVNYATAVHENLEAFHRVGQAKYLESVLMESGPFMPARVAARIAGQLG